MAQVMYHHSTYRNYQSFLVDELNYILNHGTRHESRVGMTTEVLHQTFTILRPKERFVHLTSRRNNPIATIAETLWVLSGRNDLAFLEHYLPRARQFSDDGETWRAGYGPRIRHWHRNGDDPGVDQVAQVAQRIVEDRNTRRAVISIWDPAEDWIDTKDIPCNDLLTFQLRGGKLHMTATLRSQDIIWGSMVNMFEWSVLQEAIASHLGAETGPATYMVASLHLYDRHIEMAHRIVQEGSKAHHPIYDTGIGEEEKSSAIITPLNLFDADLFAAMMIEPRIREGVEYADLIAELGDITNPFIRDSMLAIAAFNEFGRDPSFYLPKYIEQMEGYDMRYVTYGYIHGLQNAVKAGSRTQPVDVHVAKASSVGDLVSNLIYLQECKSKMYRDSWKRHGEVLSIFPNITRKYDRMVTMVAEGHMRDALTDETLIDTVGDFAVYCGLYASWLSGNKFSDEMCSNTATDYCVVEESAVDAQMISVMYDIDRVYKLLETHILGRQEMDAPQKLKLVREAMSLAIAWLVLVA